ncbi:hypothetical protein M5X11_38570 [Paenibacillus alginolyticus]|uniref:hypothetical protein n=1 Tax=Paenibacillus alginolyticus TaxID=59839 RepID=UPI000409D95F|nr:hypothetical protein [Paenibacillus alginolyticus]MCY9670730.1 hypothetical protein [Paenibacillus alginolyticus]
MEQVQEVNFLQKKLQKYIERYMYDAELSSPEALKGIIELVRSHPEDKPKQTKTPDEPSEA